MNYDTGELTTYQERGFGGACPEQYDVLDGDGNQIGHLRLRHGVFTVDYAAPEGNWIELWYAHPKGDGAFYDDERDHYIDAALTVLNAWHTRRERLYPYSSINVPLTAENQDRDLMSLGSVQLGMIASQTAAESGSFIRDDNCIPASNESRAVTVTTAMLANHLWHYVKVLTLPELEHLRLDAEYMHEQRILTVMLRELTDLAVLRENLDDDASGLHRQLLVARQQVFAYKGFVDATRKLDELLDEVRASLPQNHPRLKHAQKQYKHAYDRVKRLNERSENG